MKTISDIRARMAVEEVILEPVITAYGTPSEALLVEALAKAKRQWVDLTDTGDRNERDNMQRIMRAFFEVYPTLEEDGKVDCIHGGECCGSLSLLLTELKAPVS